MLDAINKGTTIEQNKEAVKNLAKYGITTYISLIYGLEGEDRESLERTYQHVEDLFNIRNVVEVGASTLYVLPRTIEYQKLLTKMKRKGESVLAQRRRGNDNPNLKELQQLWLQYMANTNKYEIIETNIKIIELAYRRNIRINKEERLFLN